MIAVDRESQKGGGWGRPGNGELRVQVSFGSRIGEQALEAKSGLPLSRRAQSNWAQPSKLWSL